MSKVIDLYKFRRKKPEYVIECACGCQHFFLLDGGHIQCRMCDTVSTTREWGYNDGESPPIPTDCDKEPA